MRNEELVIGLIRLIRPIRLIRQKNGCPKTTIFLFWRTWQAYSVAQSTVLPRLQHKLTFSQFYLRCKCFVCVPTFLIQLFYNLNSLSRYFYDDYSCGSGWDGCYAFFCNCVGYHNSVCGVECDLFTLLCAV